jgi:hypothetical protein
MKGKGTWGKNQQNMPCELGDEGAKALRSFLRTSPTYLQRKDDHRVDDYRLKSGIAGYLP